MNYFNERFSSSSSSSLLCSNQYNQHNQYNHNYVSLPPVTPISSLSLNNSNYYSNQHQYHHHHHHHQQQQQLVNPEKYQTNDYHSKFLILGQNLTKNDYCEMMTNQFIPSTTSSISSTASISSISTLKLILENNSKNSILNSHPNTINNTIQDQSYSDKCRQLPCKTFLSVGCCPYRDRCVYIHDPRLSSVGSKSKSRKKNKEEVDNTPDCFFWPALPRSELTYSTNHHEKHGSNTKSSVFQNYVVPNTLQGYIKVNTLSSSSQLNISNEKSPQYFNDVDAMYSMWNYFVEICQKNARLLVLQSNKDLKESEKLINDDNDEIDPPTALINRLTHSKRLPIFVYLSTMTLFNQENITKDEKYLNLNHISNQEKLIQQSDLCQSSLSSFSNTSPISLSSNHSYILNNSISSTPTPTPLITSNVSIKTKAKILCEYEHEHEHEYNGNTTIFDTNELNSYDELKSFSHIEEIPFSNSTPSSLSYIHNYYNSSYLRSTPNFHTSSHDCNSPISVISIQSNNYSPYSYDYQKEC